MAHICPEYCHCCPDVGDVLPFCYAVVHRPHMPYKDVCTCIRPTKTVTTQTAMDRLENLEKEVRDLKRTLERLTPTVAQKAVDVR